MKLNQTSILCLASFVLSLTAHAAFTRLATETYPGGGGVATNAVAGITTNGVPVALDAAKIAHLIIPEGGGPTGGVTKAYVDAHDLATLFASTNYTDAATNALDLAHLAALSATNTAIRSALASAALASTNYTDAATNAATSFVKATVTNYLPLAGGTMTGDITMGNNSLIFDSLRKISAGPDDTINFDANYYGFGGPGPIDRSFLTADGTPVVTSNMLNGVLAPATNETITAAKIYADRMGSPLWSATTAYVKGNFVWYTDETTPENTGLYVASDAGTNLPPPLNPDKWKKMDNANAIFSQDNAQLSKNFLPWKGGVNAYVEWQGQNVRVYNGGLFARTLDLQSGFGSLKAYEGTLPYTSLPDYLRGATWNTATPVTNRFAKLGEIDSATNTLEAVLVEYVDDGDAATYTSAQLYTKSYAYPFTQGNVISNTVSQWEGYWNGSNVYWSVTNYLEAGNAKVMKLYEIQTNGVHREVWNDSDKYDIFFTNTLAAVSLTNDYTVGVVSNLLDSKADRAWGQYCSTGEDAPNTNTTWISSQETVMAGGYAYRKIAVGSGTISVLVSHGSVPYATGKEASFTIGDGYGTNYFGYVAQDNFVLGADCEGITVAGGLVTMDYQVIGSTFPIMYWCDDLITKDWQQMNRSDGTAIPTAPFGGATWSLAAGGTAAKVHVNVGTAPQGFFSCMTTNIGGGTFKTNMRADFLDAGLMCTNTLSTQMGVIRPKFNGTTVEWVWSVE